VLSRAATWATGTSHQLSGDGTGASGSVSMWMAVVRVDARDVAIASRNSAMVRTRITSAPRLAALAARSIGSRAPSSWPVFPSR
jgi:hypothetical protein